ncbi:pyridoxal phosphate-dependent transferase [Lophiotrema nucula]|uniref:Pyridoxal phosphate-dependent transferase n=1 Tax=Lophiotrema nucula TaxID=690887 RepID=A0A6A5ZNU9_9PLEO|nr:pyridoxal phosphate-dependent transferase [Lophiotrema nucula]
MAEKDCVSPLGSPLEKAFRSSLEGRRQKGNFRALTLPKPNQVDFSSNDFLSLSTSNLLKTAFKKELEKSDRPLGSTGSRLLDGNSEYAEELEKEIANFHGAEAGLLFNSGFDANSAFFSSVPQPGDLIIYDSLIHASVHEGMRLSRAAQRIPFRHNSVQDLSTILRRCLQESPSLRDGNSSVIIAVESIYSMDGDICPLASLVSTVEEILPKGNGHIVVDEAHSTGVLGHQGGGLVSQLGLEKKVFARLHTFGKALGAGTGAIILGSSVLRDYLINYGKPLIYSTFLSFPALVAVRASYGLLMGGQTTFLQDRLFANISLLHTELIMAARNSSSMRSLITVGAECPQTPIFAVFTSDPKWLAKSLQERGMMVRAIMPPTVPIGTARVRVCLHGGNTEEQIRALVQGMVGWAEAQASEKAVDAEAQSFAPLTARL